MAVVVDEAFFRFDVRNNFGYGTRGVPEPATLALMLLGLGALLRRRGVARRPSAL